jgi:hypothetical protein
MLWAGLTHAARVCQALAIQRHRESTRPVSPFDPPTDSSQENHPDQFEIAAYLRDRFHEISARFLLTELQAGLALLDVADTSHNGAFNERRRSLVLEAYEVVADRLSRISTEDIPLTDAEHDEIDRLHRQLGDRLGR